jgi:hypothetical protein
MRVVGAVELGTLVLLLLNVATVHLPEFSRLLGPIHGPAYTCTIVSAILLCAGRQRIWLLSLLPGIGGLLVARRMISGDAHARVQGGTR